MKRLIALFLVCIGMASMATAQNISYSKSQAELMAWMAAPLSEDSLEIDDNYGYAPSSEKSKLGIVASALIPGTGEFYAGSWIKGALFIGAEVAGWVLLNQFDEKGDDIKAEFRAYALEHWSYSSYVTYHDSLTEPHTHKLSEEANERKDPVTQQDFEMIGKYDQFKKGWDDFDLSDPSADPRTTTGLITNHGAMPPTRSTKRWKIWLISSCSIIRFPLSMPPGRSAVITGKCARPCACG